MIDPTIVNADVINYVSKFVKEPSPVLSKIEHRARQDRQPIVSKDSGMFLHLITKLINPKRILEVGCNIGYSGTWMATALPEDGILDTIEINKETAYIAEKHFLEAGVSNKVFIHIGAGLDVIPNLFGEYDMIFIDAVKKEYKSYLELALPKIRKGGLILADNTLWSGRVAYDSEEEDNMTKALKDFNIYLNNHHQIESMILTIGDGLSLGVKI